MANATNSELARRPTKKVPESQAEEAELALKGLVGAALNPSDGSVNGMLKYVTALFGAFGCTLWQAKKRTNLISQPPRGELFVLAEYFPEPARFAMHDLPIAGTWTGEAIVAHSGNNIPDVSTNVTRNRNRHFTEEHKLGPMLCVPLYFNTHSPGAINVYRRIEQGPFDDYQLAILGHIAEIIPHLYEASRERAGFQLLRSVDEIIRQAETKPIMSLAEKQQYLKRICVEVGKAFNALETSVFLAVSAPDPKQFTLQATTWSESVERMEYRADANDSITSWILNYKQSVNVLHLPDYSPDSGKHDPEYPGMVWRKSEDFLTMVRKLLGNDPYQLPPISFMGAPIMAGDEKLGVIRVCTAKQSPYFFCAADLQLLELVAAQIGQCWSSWRARRDLVEEGDGWRSVVAETRQLNSLVQSSLAGRSSDVLTLALRAFAKCVIGANATAVRLRRPGTNELSFETTFGEFWQQGSEHEQHNRLALTFPIGAPNSPPQSIGDYVFRSRTVFEEDLDSVEFYHNAAFFPGAKREICAPISAGDDVHGVLDVVFMVGQDVPRHAKAFAELLGQQLGLYLSLTSSINRLKEADSNSQAHVRKLKEIQAEQQRTFEDLSHQLHGPLRVASGRADRMVEKMLHGLQLNIENPAIRADLLALRGLVRKAQRVARSLKLLADLERNRTLRINARRIRPSDLVRLLIEAADDTSQLVKAQGIHFHVDRESFDGFGSRTVNIDRELLEQAVDAIYGNAAKYSFDNTHVNICASLTGTKRFQITVSNTGLKIRPHELTLCKARSWRGEEALMVSGEGSGIGLWIVDEIMKAHKGELIIEPTNADSVTTVKLVFPL